MAGKHKQRLAASNSFNPSEVRLLRHILTQYRTLPDQQAITRHADYPALCRKVQTMAQKIKKAEAQRRLASRAAGEK